MNEQSAQVNFRLPVKVIDQLKARASANRRSMTSEVALLLEAALQKKVRPEAAPTAPASVSTSPSKGQE